MFWIRTALLFTSCFTVSCAQKVELNKPVASVESRNILVGQNVKLKCTYNNPLGSVKYVVWYYNNSAREVEKILYGHNKEFPSKAGPNNGTHLWQNRVSGHEVLDGFELQLKNVQIKDDNPVVCVIADNGYGRNSVESPAVPLVVSVEPSHGKIQSRPFIKAGERTSFECVSETVKPKDSISIKWHLGHEEMLKKDITVSFTLNSDGKTYKVLSTLEREYSSNDDEKELSCSVSWTFGPFVNKEISVDKEKLNVEYAQVWYGENNKEVFAEYYSAATLHCYAKSNPPITSYKWFKKDSDKVIHVGESFTFNKTYKENFTAYECEVSNKRYVPKRYEVILKESGPPQLTEIKVLPNMTSTQITLLWVAGSDGGHPPITYSIYMKPDGTSRFQLLSEDVMSDKELGSNLYYHVEGLSPQTKYEFKIEAKNRRKDFFPDKGDTKEMTATGTTKKAPVITVTNVEVKSRSLKVEWDASDLLKDNYHDNYEVTLKIEYGLKDDHATSIYPKKGTIPVTSSPEVIPGQFDIEEMYMVTLVVYENGILANKITGVDSPEYESEIATASVDVWKILLIVISIVVLVLVTLIVVFVVCRHIRKHKKERARHSQKRYHGDYLLETNIYDELRVKKTPPKLPSRNSSQKEDPVTNVGTVQNNNITAMQTVYLTQKFEPPQEMAPSTPVKNPEGLEELQPLNIKEDSDYLVPVKTPPVSMQITLNQNNSPEVSYGNCDNTTNLVSSPIPRGSQSMTLPKAVEGNIERKDSNNTLPRTLEDTHYLPMTPTTTSSA